MTALVLFPLALSLVASGGLLTWPLAHRAGRRSAVGAARRDRAEIGRILGGLPGHAALPPSPNWHRNEHRIYSWGWLVEVVARLASIGARANLPVAVEEYTPRHGDWRVSTQELAIVVAQETRRRDDEFEALLYALVARGAVLR